MPEPTDHAARAAPGAPALRAKQAWPVKPPPPAALLPQALQLLQAQFEAQSFGVLLDVQGQVLAANHTARRARGDAAGPLSDTASDIVPGDAPGHASEAASAVTEACAGLPFGTAWWPLQPEVAAQIHEACVAACRMAVVPPQAPTASAPPPPPTRLHVPAPRPGKGAWRLQLTPLRAADGHCLGLHVGWADPAPAPLLPAIAVPEGLPQDARAALAHALRNPLAPMQNALHLLQMAHDRPEAQQMAREVLQRQIDRLVRLAEDLVAGHDHRSPRE